MITTRRRALLNRKCASGLALIILLLLFLQPAGAKAAPEPGQTLVDMSGHRVELPRNIERVGTLGSVPMINTLLESLGAGDKIYNHPSAFHDIYGRWKMHLEFAPQIADGPFYQSASHELLIENILASPPDVCITMTRSIADTLRRRGIAVIYINWNSVDGMMDSIQLLGKALNAEPRAAEYIRYFHASRERLRALSAQIPADERKTVLYSNPLLFRTPGNLTEELLTAAGGNSVTLNSGKQYNLEDLLRWDPDYIFTSSPSAIAGLRREPRLKTLRAVTRGQIIYVPTVGHMWGGHTVEAPVVGYWILHKLYPHLISRHALMEEIRTFYKTFFNYDMSHSQLATLIGDPANDGIQEEK